jgi:rhodanese-related sulfurtransferase
MASFNEISVQKLSKLIGTPECPLIVDVRIDEDFEDDPELIPTAFRHPHNDILSIVETTCNRNVIIYCQKGLKLSQGAAAILRNQGVNVETLEGGQIAWRDANLPMVSTSQIPALESNKKTVWVTRHRPKIDRVACPWFIKRFVDPNAQFLFVSPSQVLNVAEKFDAIPFDVEGVFWSHRGDKCTFDTMLNEFNIHTEALDRLAKIIRCADTNSNNLAPEAAGLLAVSLGLSRMFRDDLKQLDAAMLLYDALFRWARDATDEKHDWPVTAGKHN